jgi:hypothetical protein
MVGAAVAGVACAGGVPGVDGFGSARPGRPRPGRGAGCRPPEPELAEAGAARGAAPGGPPRHPRGGDPLLGEPRLATVRGPACPRGAETRRRPSHRERTVAPRCRRFRACWGRRPGERCEPPPLDGSLAVRRAAALMPAPAVSATHGDRHWPSAGCLFPLVRSVFATSTLRPRLAEGRPSSRKESSGSCKQATGVVGRTAGAAPDGSGSGPEAAGDELRERAFPARPRAQVGGSVEPGPVRPVTTQW